MSDDLEQEAKNLEYEGRRARREKKYPLALSKLREALDIYENLADLSRAANLKQEIERILSLSEVINAPTEVKSDTPQIAIEGGGAIKRNMEQDKRETDKMMVQRSIERRNARRIDSTQVRQMQQNHETQTLGKIEDLLSKGKLNEENKNFPEAKRCYIEVAMLYERLNWHRQASLIRKKVLILDEMEQE